MEKLRIIFFGTPTLSANILTDLLNCDTLEIVAIVSNPDKKSGRGHEILSSPVAHMAKEKNIPLFQPEKIKSDEIFLENIRNLNPDLSIVVAYGKILPQILLDIPRFGFLNVHTSLLPKYRGAAPIQHALLNGEKTTGLTIMQMSLGMDEGDILLQESWDIKETDTTHSLFEKTGKRGGPMLVEVVKQIQSGTLSPVPQDHTLATYTQMIHKEDGELKPEWTLDQTYHAWQAYTSWPGLFTNFLDNKVTLLEIEKFQKKDASIVSLTPEWHIIENLPAYKVSDGFILMKKIHPSGKKPMSGEDFVRGYMGVKKEMPKGISSNKVQNTK